MKLATLRNYFRRSPTTKLYVTTDKFAFAGYASNPREEENGLLLDATPCVIYWFAKGALESSDAARTLHLTSDTLVTRRLHTHRRHLRGRTVPEEYLHRAPKV